MDASMTPTRVCWVVFLLLIQPLFGPQAGAQQRIRPYTLHEVRLGTPLSQLRKLNFLRQEQQDKLRLICSNDSDAVFIDQLATVITSQGPAVRCGLFERGGGDSPAPGRIEVFGEETQLTFVLYRGERDSEVRLAQITGTLRGERFDEVISLLRKTYGAPSNYEMNNVSTQYGYTLNASWFWNNGVSSIQADLLTLDATRMNFIFSYDELMRAAQEYTLKQKEDQ
jgi:hypothetical protein